MADRPVTDDEGKRIEKELPCVNWFAVAVWAGNRTVTTCSGFNTKIRLTGP